MAGSKRSIRTLWDRLLAGPGQADPLYLSNRTWKQKLRVWLLVCTPVAAVAGVAVYLAVVPPASRQAAPEILAPAEVAARTAVIPEGFRVDQNTDLQILEVAVDRSTGLHIAGVLKNNTGRRFAAAELSFNLTDEEGSQVGGASTRVDAIGPHDTVRFRFPIANAGAVHALVREVRGTF